MTSNKQLINALETALTLSKTLNKDKEVENCPYCLEEIKDVNAVTLPCGHKCDLKCLLSDMFIKGKMEKVKCCLCRGDIMTNNDVNELRKTRESGEREEQERQNEYLRELRQQQRQNDEQWRQLMEEQRENDEIEEQHRERQRREETARFEMSHPILRNNRRINLLDSWRLRRNTCGYEILQTILDARQTTMNYRECCKVMGRLKNSYTTDTYRRNLHKLKDKGYITWNENGAFITELKLTPAFVNINLD
jgi:hypothetical protein